MNADLLAMLGQVPGVSGSNRRENEPKTLLSFKAGKMIAELQPNGKYMVKADPRRGTLEVNWTASSSSRSSSSGAAGVLKLEWKDRRTRAVVDSLTIFPEDDCTYSRVDTGAGREGDRVYLLQYGNASDRRFFFWMQEKEEGNQDEDHCVKINTFMAEPERAAAVANGEDIDASPSEEEKSSATGGKNDSGSSAANTNASGALDSNALMSIMQGLNAGEENANASGEESAAGGVQVDALSNILENLGMPQNAASANTSTDSDTNAAVASAESETASTATPAPSATPNTTAAVTGGLTLSDLQGAMAGLATTSPPAAPRQTVGPPLHEVVSPANILQSGILNDPATKAKLISLLPENQRTEEKLMENIQSPQVQQCLKSLQSLLLEDEASVNSILANFQLRPEDGAIAMAAGNPIQAFLDCVLKRAQRENDANVEASADADEKEDDTEMKE
jgi:26S proteasome regulatory subunit N13